MYVCVYPQDPSPGLLAALTGIGFEATPVGGLGELAALQPEGGWGVAIVELPDDPSMAMTVAGKIRDEHQVPVLLIADRAHTPDLLDRGGYDDFLLRPVDRAELRVRLHRLGPEGEAMDEPEVMRFRDLELNTATYQATVDGRPTDLTYMEYELLRFFVTNRGRVWSREQILSKVWGYDYFGGSRTVDVHVRRLRAKLGEERASWISTVRSVGYRFG
jgi:DNA-binding response OmpR family regulator